MKWDALNAKDNFHNPSKIARTTKPKFRLSVWSAIFIGVFFCLAVFTSCSNWDKNISPSDTFIALDDFEIISDTLLSIEYFIPLETVSTNLMGMDLRIKFSDTLIFVMDESVKDGIHVFGISGEYLQSIANVGEGPGMIPSLDDFHVKKDGNVSVLSTIGDKASVYTTSLESLNTKRIDIDFIATSFAELEGQGFLFYGGYNLPFVSHRVVKTDTNGLILNKYLENDYKNSMLPMTERNFFASPSGIAMLESFNPQIYHFRNDSLVPILGADFGRYSLPPEFWEKDIMESFALINQKGFANFRSFYKKGADWIADVMIQKESDVFKFILIQKGDRKFRLKADFKDEMLFYYPIGITSDSLFAFVTYSSILENEMINGNLIFPQKKLSQGVYDYPVIIYAKLRDDL